MSYEVRWTGILSILSSVDDCQSFAEGWSQYRPSTGTIYILTVILSVFALKWLWTNRNSLPGWIWRSPSRPMSTSILWGYRKRGGGIRAVLRLAPLVAQPTFPGIRPRCLQGNVKTVAVLDSSLPTKTISSSDFANLEVLGAGGESKAVYKTAANTAWKIFRTPDDPWFQGQTPEMQAARDAVTKRLLSYPSKLPQFPTWIGSRVIAPQNYLKIAGENFDIGGYEMRMVEKSEKLNNLLDPTWKSKHRISTRRIGKIFLDLYDTICELHSCGVIIGDFKPDNVLFSPQKNVAYVIDAESMTFGAFACTGFSEGYVDPRLCDRNADTQTLIHQHDRDSDWYAFTVMLFEALTNVHPYQGVYKPPKGEAFVSPAVRPLKGISVFNPNVKVPNFVQDISQVASWEMERFFFDVFEQGRRGRPERKLLEELASVLIKPGQFQPLKQTCWSKYPISNSVGAPMGQVVLQPLYQGSGEILCSKMIDSNPRLMIREGQKILDQSKGQLLDDNNNQCDAFECGRNSFLFRRQDTFYLVTDSSHLAIKEVGSSIDGRPNIGLQGDCAFWVDKSGALRSTNASQRVATISGHSSLFTGDSFGLVCAVEDEELAEILLLGKDVTRLTSLPPIMGRITDIECSFSKGAVWIFLSATWNGETARYIVVISAKGQLLGLGAAPNSSGTWYSKGIPRAAYEVRRGQGKEPELACLVGNLVFRVTCRDLKIMPESCQKTSGGKDAKMLLSDGKALFI